MSFDPALASPLWAGESASPSASVQRGLNYLHQVDGWALAPGMVNRLEGVPDRLRIASWIGENIASVNGKLNDCLQACHDCFYPTERRALQIFAAPLAPNLSLDGVCNIHSNPMTLLIDVGRVAPTDWLAIVAHEYAHAHLGNSGHDATFATLLSHLCLGLGLEQPTWEAGMETKLRHWPPCAATADPLAFWRGQG